jgi:alkylhydroperoxidase/carboxymuconolactone decarboxylase family protein YurZ
MTLQEPPLCAAASASLALTLRVPIRVFCVLPLGDGEPPAGEDLRRLATIHTFGDSWPRSGLDDRSRALISVTIAATLGTHEPLRGQVRIALNSSMTKEEIVELFIHLAACAGAARAFDSYQIALAVFAEVS